MSTPQRLLSVASNLFAADGFAGVSMRTIADTAGLTQAAIYHHFPNKEALYLAAVRSLHAEKTVALTQDLARDIPCRERLVLLVQRMLALLDEDPDFRRIVLRELLDGDEHRLGELANNVFAEIADRMEGLLRELAPEQDSHLVLISLTGLILYHLEARKLSAVMSHSGPEHQQLPVLAEHISTLVLRGVQAA